MDDLVRQILAAIEETEQIAHAATPGPWEYEGDDVTDDEVYTVHDGEHGDLVGNVVAYTRGGDRQQPNTVHIARHDPDAMLRRCAADRRIAETCQFWLHEDDRGIDPCAKSVLLDLADVYDVHPNPEPGSPMAEDLAQASAGDTVAAEVVERDLASKAAATATVRQEEDWFIAQATAPDVASQGRTEAEARANLREAVELYLTNRHNP